MPKLPWRSVVVGTINQATLEQKQAYLERLHERIGPLFDQGLTDLDIDNERSSTIDDRNAGTWYRYWATKELAEEHGKWVEKNCTDFGMVVTARWAEEI